MSYPQSGGLLDFFVPVQVIAANSTKPLCAINIAAANGTHGEYVCVVPCTLRQLQATVVLATVSTSTVPVITFKHYTLPGAGGTATTIDTISIPDAQSVGKTYYVKDLSQKFLPGQVMQISWTLGTGGSVAGEVVVSGKAEHLSESPANSALMVVSA